MPGVRPPLGRLLLRPGVAAVRRDPDTLQVGLTPPHAVRLRDVEPVRDLLAELRAGLVPAGLHEEADRALAALVDAGLAVPCDGRPDTPGLRVAQAQFGADGARRLACRSAHGVGVRADGATREVATELLTAAGLRVDDATPAVWLVASPGPLAREGLDDLQRSGVPHVVVAGELGSRRVGPFVEPGRTACLRCVDAHEAESDPRRPFLVEQAARASGPTEPHDPVLDRLALAWATRDVLRYLEGDEPSTWSATVDIGPVAPPTVTRWLRHHHCGCAWDLLLQEA
ncbi:MAG TPA: hypothetical protein VD859_07515 [Nocardioides sp.]|nr:hypothetical protein [Nocardioides sp.]